MALVVTVATMLAACSGSTPSDGMESAEPRPLTAEESTRLALSGYRAYEADVRSVEGVVASGDATVQIVGWIDTVDHRAYAMIRGADVTPFLASWTTSEIAARDFDGAGPPLPIPTDGWTAFPLDPDQSHLAAAQVLLVSLSDTRPENAQLLRQNGATRYRRDRVGDTPVDVMSGPVPDGATASSFRYWVDDDGVLHRLEARLDGERWSTFDFVDTPDVDLGTPPIAPAG